MQGVFVREVYGRGLHARGACMSRASMVKGDHVWQGVCMSGEVAHGKGACIVGRGMWGRRMHGRGPVWHERWH